MTKDEHERERRAFWDACCAAQVSVVHGEIKGLCESAEAEHCAQIADAKLAERDKRFPMPEDKP